jgi:hypothetical protein
MRGRALTFVSFSADYKNFVMYSVMPLNLYLGTRRSNALFK